MRGSAAFRVSVAPGGGLAPSWVRDPLSRNAGASPSLDLRFADSKSLVDSSTGANLVTFTRASSGTYVGSDGLIKTATTNLLLRSEEFNDAAWGKVNATITANAIASPDGQQTADKLIENTAASVGHYVSPSPNPSTTAGQSYTYSVFAKAAERTFFQLIITAVGPSGGNLIAGFDLAGGIAGTPSSGSLSSITPLGNGWYRCSLSLTASATTTPLAQIRLALNSSASPSSYTGDGTSGIYIWGAQLEQSSTVGEYIPTTSTINSAPRFDHNPTTGESLGLLVEEQRTNLCLQSQAISTSPWAPNGIETCVTSTLTDPAGGTSAFKINFGGTGSFERWQQSITVVSGTTYTLSAWVRSTTGTTLFRLRFAGGVTSSDLTATTTWQRFSFTLTAGTTAGAFAFNAPSSGAATEIHVWGAQLEAGSFPTSYISTTTATVTRSADVASITGANFSSWYNQTEGTVYWDGISGDVTPSAFPQAFQISNNTTSNRLQVTKNNGSGNARMAVVSGGVTQAAMDATTWTSNARTKFSFGYGLDNFALTVNAATLATDTSGTVPSVSQINVGQDFNATNILNGTIRRLTYWPSRLPNATLQQITR